VTNRADYTDEEWARLERAPLVAGFAISLADPGGPIEALKESTASIKTVLETARTGSGAELVVAVARDVKEKAEHRENPLGGFRPRGPNAGEQVLEDLSAVNRLLSEKATPEEADAFRAWLLTAAQRAADAAKEGGFMGFRAERVSEGERDMLNRLREALSLPRD
jgi:hypothetical protein